MVDDIARMEQVIARVEKLPTISAVVVRLTKLLESTRTSAKQVTEVLSEDQALTAKILKLANSSYYGFAGQIATTQQAVVLLGFETLRNVALSASVIEVFRGTQEGREISRMFGCDRFWEHSIGAAVIARLVAAEGKLCDPEEAFVVGLLHDIGKLIMLEYLPEEFAAVLRSARSREIPFVEAELGAGVNHAGLGRFLIERWNLPRSISEGVGFHHSFRAKRPTAAFQAIAHFADFFVRARGVGDSGDGRIPPLSPEAWEALDLGTDRFKDLLAQFDAEMLKASVFIEMARGERKIEPEASSEAGR